MSSFDFESLYRRAHIGGAIRTSVLLQEWSISGTCESPVALTRQGIIGTPVLARRRGSMKRDHHTPMAEVRMETPCRKCKKCLQFRSFIWRCYARHEIEFACRTWFSTLTLTPGMHYRYQAMATHKWPEFDTLSDNEQTLLRHKMIGPQITLMLKRLRKQQASVGGLRYIIVMEPHLSGLPHYHLLLHEQSELAPLRKTMLHDQWTDGFSSHKLVDDKAAAYITKYLAKSAAARVRASLRYGRTLFSIESSSPTHPQSRL